MSDKTSPLSFANALGVTNTADATPVLAKQLSKAEQDLLQSNVLDVEMEDQFLEMYGADMQVRVIQPPHNLINLDTLTVTNNALSQCVRAMEVNVDGTGYNIVPAHDDKPSEEEEARIVILKSFFDEPFPGMSFTSFRKGVRKDLERTGNAYIEIIRSKKGEIVFMNRVPSVSTRLVQLDDPVPVSVEIERMGQTQNVKIMKRERRYIQAVGRKFVYFKEFSASRELDKETGYWSDEETPLRQGHSATEIIHLKVDDDTLTPYGVPRWINQTPSILGSRRAEEFNLDFFNHGGLPPAIIFLQGAALNEESKKTLTNYLAGKAKFKQRAVIISTYASEGAVGSSTAGSKVTVERFGSERQSDSMFEGYDKRCFERVRSAFRLPPIFLGYSDDYNFATAVTAYMVAEAQVFQPERTEFDEMINLLIMPLLDKNYRLRSKQLTVKDIESQLKALELGAAFIDSDSFVEALNEVAGLNVIGKEPEQMPEAGIPEVPASEKMLNDLAAQAKKDGAVVEGDDDGKIAKIDDSILMELADDWSKHLSGDNDFSDASIATMDTLIKSLSPTVRKLFNGFVATRMLPEATHDLSGVADLIGCAGECLHDGESDPL